MRKTFWSFKDINIYLLCSLALISSCSGRLKSTDDTSVILQPPLVKMINSSSQGEIEKRNYIFKYNMEAPSSICKLPPELLEISALTYNLKNGKLLAVNDEKPDVYEIDIQKCQVEKQFDFGKKGDYEGIEIVDKICYILKSSGSINLYDIKGKSTLSIIKTALSELNDVEGLGYNPKQKELILACKGAPQLDGHQKLKDAKAFYAFDLTKMELIESPKFLITDEELISFVQNKITIDLSKKKKEKLLKRVASFSPSAIAKHPYDETFFILSSVGKLLFVVDNNGILQDVQFLDEDIFIQPEGICFSPEGTLYISNEGKSLVANILTFNLIDQ